MRIKELFEGMSPVLYHFTTFDAASGILKSNSIRSRLGEISFSRSVIGSYPTDHKMIGVIFEIDGKGISANHRGSPVGGDDYDENAHKFVRIGKTDQLEDRVYSKEIKNIKAFINRAIIFLPKEWVQTRSGDELDGKYETQLKHLKATIQGLRGIPFMVATSVRDLPRVNGMLRLIPPDYNTSLSMFAAEMNRTLPEIAAMLGMKEKTKWNVRFYVHATGNEKAGRIDLDSSDEWEAEMEAGDKLDAKFGDVDILSITKVK